MNPISREAGTEHFSPLNHRNRGCCRHASGIWLFDDAASARDDTAPVVPCRVKYDCAFRSFNKSLLPAA